MPTLIFDGYVRITMPYKISYYKAQVRTDDAIRVLRPRFLTIGEAIHYGRKVCERFNRLQNVKAQNS